MNTCLRFLIGTSAAMSCRATPLPQSTTYAASLITMTWEVWQRDLYRFGPPAVPSKIKRVPACTLGAGLAPVACACATACGPPGARLAALASARDLARKVLLEIPSTSAISSFLPDATTRRTQFRPCPEAHTLRLR